jgi:simple sugar transport system substrate-binding protein
MRIDGSRRPLRVLAVVAAASAALAACSSQGGAQDQAPAAGGGGGGGGGGGPQLTIQMITHEQAGDTFWDKIRAGAEDAARNTGVTLQYSNNENGPEQATLVQNAIDARVSGIAVTLSNADAVIPVAKRAADAGIPVVVFNQGIDQYQEAGSKMYFGSDEALAGQTVGQRLAAGDPGGKTLCIIQAQGSVALETRCQGVKQAYPNTENLQVNGADLPSVQQTIQSKLAQDTSISNIVTLGAPIALAAQQAQAAAGTTAKIATFDLNQEAAQAIKDGAILFSVDQQPYVQGYMAVTSLYLNLTNGNDIGGGKATLTGPSIVDTTNIDQILPYTANNRR